MSPILRSFGFVALLLGIAVARADVDAGIAAYERGDYTSPEAEQLINERLRTTE